MMAASKDTDGFTQRSYKLRPGTTDLGRDYEYKILTLFSLRCILQNFQDMWLATNVEGVGAFDDVILHVEKARNKSVTYLLQLKHKENPKPITEQEFLAKKGDFALLKYAQDISKLESLIGSKSKGIVSDLGDNINFLIFTNRTVNAYDYLEQNVSNELLFLNTNATIFNLHRFNSSKLCWLTENAHLNPENLDMIAKINLFTKQVHAKHLNKHIEAKIERIIEHFSLLPINVKHVAEKFTKYIADWAKGNLGGSYYLTKKHISIKLSELLLNQYEFDLSLERCRSYDCDQNYIWNRLVQDKTITVVDCDDRVIEFLKQYIGSEVKNYLDKFEETFKHKLSDEALNILYIKHKDLKQFILQRVGNYGKVTTYDVCKCLWMHNKLPLLLYVNEAKEYEDIIKILKLSDYKLKTIVINKSAYFISTPNFAERFITLCDLSEVNQMEILKLSVALQGKAPIPLGNIIDASMYHHIKCNDIVHILVNDFNIGNKHEPLSEYYIDRNFFKIFLKFNVLQEVKDEIFILKSDPNDRDTLVTTLTSINSTNVFMFEDEKQIRQLKSKNKPIHRLTFYNKDCMMWMESIGSIANILGYKIDPQDCCQPVEHLFEGDADPDLLNNTHVISECPGMGKSTIIDYISLNVPPDVWVLKLVLNKYEDYYENLHTFSALEHLHYFYDAVLRKYGCSNEKLARAVFEKLLNSNKVLILLDGFDEISLLYKDQVTKIAKSFHDKGFRIWLTTRPHFKSHLEEEFSTIALTLRPFDWEDQAVFLMKYFTRITKSSNPDIESSAEVIKNFVFKLLTAAMVNLEDLRFRFLGIPLQTKLLADVFSKDLEVSIRERTVKLNENFDLLYLYEEFIRRKTEILCQKFGNDAKYTCGLFRKQQQLLALKFLFKNLNLDDLMSESYNRQFLQRDGIIVIEEQPKFESKFIVSFMHRTFAEFLAAQWLSENCNTEDDSLRRIINKLVKLRFAFWSSYDFLFKMFDSLLGRNFQAHMDIINKKINTATALLNLGCDTVRAVDVGGRTILHLIALYNGEEFANENRDDAMLHAIDQLAVTAPKLINKDALGYSPLDYAIARSSYTTANKICQLYPDVTLSYFNSSNITYCFDTCKRFESWDLLKVIARHLICQDVLTNRLTVKKGTTLEFYFEEFDYVYSHFNFRSYIDKVGVTTVFELLEKINIKSTGHVHFHDVRFAIACGTAKNVKELLSENVNINSWDEFGNTLLHYAVFNKRAEIFEMLVSRGADINRSNSEGDIALHFTSKRNHKKMVQKLLSLGAEVDRQNDEGCTPLSLALRYDKVGIAELLLSKNARTDQVCKRGQTVLHYAAQAGTNSMVRKLIDKGVDVNQPDKKGATALFCALEKEHIKCAKLLMANGADIYAESENNTCLHYAAISGAYDMVKDLINRGFDINKQNNDGVTPLFLAIQCKHNRIANLLISKGADANIRDGDNNSCLHYAAKHGFHELVSKLLEYEDKNITNTDNETPLHQAVAIQVYYDMKSVQRHIETVKLLLRKEANVNAQDEKGQSALHYISNVARSIFQDDAESKKFICRVAILLLNEGINIYLKDRHEQTALDLAFACENTKVISLIQQKIRNPRELIKEPKTICCCIEF